MKLTALKGNWGLKLLSLALAIVIYCSLKHESSDSSRFSHSNDRKSLHTR